MARGVPNVLERFFKRYLDSNSGDVDHDKTSNRTHSGDSIGPQSVSTDSATINTSLTDPNGTGHTGELADASDVSSIQSSSDVDHSQTTGTRTHSGDSLSPNSVDLSNGTLTIPEVTSDPANGNLWIRSDL